MAGFSGATFLSGLVDNRQKQNEFIAFPLVFLAGASLVAGPVIGAGTGAGLYGAKRSIQYLRSAPRPTKVVAGVLFATSITAATAYKLGYQK